LVVLGKREKLGITPHIELAAGEVFASRGFFEGVVVVDNFEGGETVFAEGPRFIAPGLSTFSTSQFIQIRHWSYL
jgi:hypothetical protein